MSIEVALQSVAFYVLSCTTCSKFYHRQKAKKVARRERAEKHALETEQPGLYRHPSPFNTNPYWNEEIMLGPGPPKRKGDKAGSKNPSSRVVNTAGQGSSINSSACLSTEPGSSPTMVDPDQRLSGDDWNRKRYQREDEELWGIDPHRVGQRFREALAKAESSVGSKLRNLEGRLNKNGPLREEERSPYYVARNPPVNDLHPPVVSTQPTNWGATRWMLQPPPPAKVMEGKERASRSRSGSRGSSRLGMDSSSLSRQVTGRAIEERLRRGEAPPELELRSVSSRTESKITLVSPRSQPTVRGRSHSLDSSGSSDGGLRWRRKPLPFSLAADEIASPAIIEHTPVSREGKSRPTKPEPREGKRPALATITSSSIAISPAESKESNERPADSVAPNDTGRKMTLKAAIPSDPSTLAIPVPLAAVNSNIPAMDTHELPLWNSQEENEPQPRKQPIT